MYAGELLIPTRGDELFGEIFGLDWALCVREIDLA